jgi:hypothetical protein
MLRHLTILEFRLDLYLNETATRFPLSTIAEENFSSARH